MYLLKSDNSYKTPLKTQVTPMDTNRENTLFNQAPTGMIEWSLEGKILRINPRFGHLIGYPPQELQGHSLMEIIHPDDIEGDRPLIDQLLEGELQTFMQEKRYLHQDGSMTWVNLAVSLLYTSPSTPPTFLGVVTDTSEHQAVLRDRRKAQQALKESERRFRAIFNSAFGFMTLLSPEGEILEANHTLLEFAGVQLSDVIDQDIWNAPWWPQDYANQEQLKAKIKQAAKGKTLRCTVDFLGINQQSITVDFSLKPVMDSCGKVVMLIAEGRDISDRQALQKELVWRDQLWNAFFKAAPIGMAILDKKMRFVQVNETLASTNDSTIGDHLTKTISEINPYRAKTLEPHLREVLTSGKPLLNIEVSHETPRLSGVVRHWLENYFPLTTEQGQSKGVGMICIDMTARKQAEHALRHSESLLKEKNQQLQETLCDLKRTQSHLIQAEKMSSLGQMVAGVAHEINNPVNFIYGNLLHAENYMQDLVDILQLYQDHYPQPHPEIAEATEVKDLDFLLEDLPELLHSMTVGTERIREIVKSMRTFSRLDESAVKSVDIHEGIDSTLLILHNRMKVKPDYPGIEVIKEYGELPKIECYAGQLNQVVMNILSNAIDAIDESLCSKQGHLQEPREGQIRIATQLLDSNWVAIRIQDNGMGIPERVKQRLFDPFFTTKPVGKGTGLGLSISYQIVVKNHGGKMDCHSIPGEGTEFIIHIPCQQG
ncbi:hypothetical protein BI308_14990 [Roseofilum reptotaenium AO1-A]|uniref:histidine kinase n=2 Tax=Roseofilum TaxID=1233426 RepID=A0A1L9QPX3_9CYAN|nr:hypothetical protein BI308_14990 [Roseofilum reptotaenium AO1-A]